MTDLYLPPQSLAASNVSFESLDLSWAAVTQIHRTITVPGDMPQNTKLMLHGDGNVADDMGLNTPSWYGTAGYAAGKFGQAMSFGGSSYVQIPYRADFNFGSGDWTIACWVYYPTKLSRYPRIFEITTNDFHLEINSSGYMYMSTCGATGSTSTTFPIGQWVHAAVVRHGSQVKLYQDGVSVLTFSVSAAASYNTANPVVIGHGRAEGGTNYFEGRIDEFIMTPSALWTSNFTPPTAPYTKTSSTETIQPATPSGYKIYRDGALYATTAGTSYHVSGLALNTDYTWTVSAYDENDGGELSAAVSTRTLDGYVIPEITAVVLAPNPVVQSTKYSISITITEKAITLEPVWDFSGEIYSGEDY